MYSHPTRCLFLLVALSDTTQTTTLCVVWGPHYGLLGPTLRAVGAHIMACSGPHYGLLGPIMWAAVAHIMGRWGPHYGLLGPIMWAVGTHIKGCWVRLYELLGPTLEAVEAHFSGREGPTFQAVECPHYRPWEWCCGGGEASFTFLFIVLDKYLWRTKIAYTHLYVHMYIHVHIHPHAPTYNRIISYFFILISQTYILL